MTKERYTAEIYQNPDNDRLFSVMITDNIEKMTHIHRMIPYHTPGLPHSTLCDMRTEIASLKDDGAKKIREFPSGRYSYIKAYQFLLALSSTPQGSFEMFKDIKEEFKNE